MTFITADRVLETSTTTGTGAITLAGAVTGFRAFSAVCATSDTVPYYIEAVDGSGVPTGDWETGLGTYSAANTLTRTTVYASSNSGSAVSFAAGTKRVGLGLISDRAVTSDGDGVVKVGAPTKASSLNVFGSGTGSLWGYGAALNVQNDGYSWNSTFTSAAAPADTGLAYYINSDGNVYFMAGSQHNAYADYLSFLGYSYATGETYLFGDTNAGIYLNNLVGYVIQCWDSGAVSLHGTADKGSVGLNMKGSLWLNGSTSGTVEIKTNAAAGTYTMTLPDENAPGYLLNDGSGNLSWSASSALALIDTQTYNSGASNWTKPSGAKLVEIILVGGGGGGASGAAAVGTGACGGAGGGAGGAVVRVLVPADTLGSTVAYSVGSGGSGGSAVSFTGDGANGATAGKNGSAGTASTFGNYAAGPGGGGSYTAANNTVGYGGIPDAPTVTQNANSGVVLGGVSVPWQSLSGAGGSGSATDKTPAAVAAIDTIGPVPGGGGYGGTPGSTTSAETGGDGADAGTGTGTTKTGGAGGTSGNAGGAGTAGASDGTYAGGGGGGYGAYAASGTATATAGGNGGAPGGGGGGGGSARNNTTTAGNNSQGRAGGNGGAGRIIIRTFG